MESFLASLDPWVIYVVIAGLTIGESAAFAGLVFPGEIGLVTAAALGVTTGVNPWVLVGVATVGAMAGGLIGYAIGRRYGSPLVQWEPVANRLGKRIADLRPMLSGPDAAALVAVARFNQVTRAVVPALAGMSDMPLMRFAVANGLGALLWAGAFTAVGYYAADFWRSTSGLVHLIGLAVVVGGSMLWLVSRSRRRRTEAGKAPLRDVPPGQDSDRHPA